MYEDYTNSHPQNVELKLQDLAEEVEDAVQEFDKIELRQYLVEARTFLDRVEQKQL